MNANAHQEAHRIHQDVLQDVTFAPFHVTNALPLRIAQIR